jgi:hypothetical protein
MDPETLLLILAELAGHEDGEEAAELLASRLEAGPGEVEKLSESHRLPGVEVFAAGSWRGKDWTAADLADMAANHAAFSTGERAYLRVPAVLGHSEEQLMLAGSELPAAAWAERVAMKGGKLATDFDHMPENIASLIKAKRYRTVSAEVYPHPPEGVGTRAEILAELKRRGKDPLQCFREACREAKGGPVEPHLRKRLGKMLRRVAFLGGDIPHVKGLADIPMPEPHSERFDAGGSRVLRFHHATEMPGGAYAVFSEVHTMDRAKLIEALQGYGMDTAALTDVVPDEVLAEFLRVLEGKEAEEPKEPAEGATTPPASEGFSEKSVAALVAREVAKAVKAETKKSLGELSRFHEETVAGQKKAAVESFVEAQSKAGRITPAQRESVTRRLLRADSRVTVEKFTEGGKVRELTELDLQMREIANTPTFFGERVRSSGAAPSAGDEAKTPESRKAWAESYFDAHPELKATGNSRESFGKTFAAMSPETFSERKADFTAA